MKLTMICLIISVFSAQGRVYSQKTKITLDLENVKVRTVLEEIQSQTKFKFLYNNKKIDDQKRVSVQVKDKPVSEILDSLFKESDIYYVVKKQQIILKLKPVRLKPTFPQTKVENQDQDQRQISGQVKDKDNIPIPGVNILVKGTDTGTVTDWDGNYEITVPKDVNTLVFSYVGFLTEEEPINKRNVIDVTLEEDIAALDEIVVVGYGVQKKGNLTSAISTIKSKDIQTTTSVSLAQKLQGKVPGLQIRQQDGEPGSFASSINIRGFGEPLYVIDGIVRDGGVEFQQLNPADIESVTVLKDASAAVYGLNAANGVIMVTTKKGKTGKPNFQYNTSVGFQIPTDVPKMSSASQYMEMYNDAIFFRDGTHYLTSEELQNWKNGGPGYGSTNWFDETFKKQAVQKQHNLSVTGGTESVNYFVSLGTFNEDGLFKSDDMSYKRYNLRSNLTLHLSKSLKADLQLSGRYSERRYPGGDGFIWTYKGTIISLPNETPYINGDPNYPANIFNQQNPVLMAQDEFAGYTNMEDKDFNSALTLTYDMPFIKGLQGKATIAYDSRNMFNKNVWKNYTVYSPDLTPQVINPPRIANAIDNANRLVFQGQLSYEKTFSERHHLSATAVFEQKHYEETYSYLKREYEFFTTDVVDYASGLQTNSGSEVEEATMSYIGRLNYDYKGKYLVSGAFRYDGSYRYAPDSRWGFFPTVSAGWRISEESFIKDNLTFVNNLKFRASYGEIGENVGAPFQHVIGFNSAPNQGAEFTNGEVTGGLTAPGVVNPNFTWVKSAISDIGVEGSFFDNKLTFEADYYERKKTGKLKRREGGLPNTFGGEMPIENLESELTRGFDFIVSHQNKINDFEYGISVNMNLSRTMHLDVDKPEARSSMDRWKNGLENRWNDYSWGYTKIGQFQNEEEITQGVIHGGDLGNSQLLPGDFIYKDINGDGIINGNDQLPIFRNRNPKLFYGFTLNASYKNFDFNTVFQGAALYSIRFNEVYSLMFFNDGNVPAYFHDRWHLENPYDPNSAWVPGTWPASRFSENMQSSYRESSAWRMNASYLRMKSIELGYSLPKEITDMINIQSMRIYANAHNLFTFTDPMLKMFDPEKYEGPYNAGYNYPLMKSFNLGVNLSF